MHTYNTVKNMNITLSADEKLIKKARDYANRHNTSLNALVRDFLKEIVNDRDAQKAADEFEMIALTYGGNSKRSASSKGKNESKGAS